MADYKELKPFILRWEGGYADDPADSGGATNRGVTLATYRAYRRKKGLPAPAAADLKRLTDAEWDEIFVGSYWNRWKADRIECQSVADLLVDWVWCSGAYGVKIPQYLLGVAADGIVGERTLAALNGWKKGQRDLFGRLKEERAAFIGRICKSNPRNRKFKNGWLNRIDALKWNG